MSSRPGVFTAAALLQILQSAPATGRYLVGFSGGADSTALLHALNEIQARLTTPISAVHVNHGLHDDAGIWQTHCVGFCRHLGIRIHSLKIDVNPNSDKVIEAEARRLRYAAINTLLKPGDTLLTAHHADDQAETLLLNLMRGSGVDGLSAMPAHRPLGDGILLRPLLSFQNSALIQYLNENRLEWLNDPSNALLDQDRNFIRHSVIPMLESRWPEISKRLLLTRKAMSEARLLLEKTADEYLRKNQPGAFVLRLTSSICGEPALFKLATRRWLKHSGAPPIPAYRLETLFSQVQHAQSGHKVVVNWDDWCIRLYRQQLWLLEDDPVPDCPTGSWPDGMHKVDLGVELGMLSFEGKHQQNPGAGLSFGNRNSIGQDTLLQGQHHKSLKNLFQSAGIPPWLRNSIPLCLLNDELIALGDWSFSDSFKSWMSENEIALKWTPQSPLLRYVRKQQKTGTDNTRG